MPVLDGIQLLIDFWLLFKDNKSRTRCPKQIVTCDHAMNAGQAREAVTKLPEISDTYMKTNMCACSSANEMCISELVFLDVSA